MIYLTIYFIITINSFYLIQNLKNKFRFNCIALHTKPISHVIHSQTMRLATLPINKQINILDDLESVFALMLYTLLLMIAADVLSLILIGYIIIRTMRRYFVRYSVIR